jgi:hypothetical protein
VVHRIRDAFAAARELHGGGSVRTRWHLIFGLVLAPIALAPNGAVAQLTNTPVSVTAQHSGKCLDVSGASVADGAAVVSAGSRGDDAYSMNGSAVMGRVTTLFRSGVNDADSHSTQVYLINRGAQLVWRTSDPPTPREIANQLLQVA